jgi:hypothetical protein
MVKIMHLTRPSDVSYLNLFESNSMASTRTLSTWLEIYADLMMSNPGLARWAEASLEDLTKVTKGRLNKPDKFITTMATCSPFGAIIVHGTEGK